MLYMAASSHKKRAQATHRHTYTRNKNKKSFIKM